jgi:hypothetical protein
MGSTQVLREWADDVETGVLAAALARVVYVQMLVQRSTNCKMMLGQGSKLARGLVKGPNSAQCQKLIL